MSEKNKKRIVTSLAALFVMLAMISLCLLGSTMARYTSGGSASASVDIAKWNVSVTNSGSPYTGSTKVTFDKLSPKYDQNSTYTSTEVNYTSLVTVATITLGYDTDVDVSLSLGYDALTYNGAGGQVSFDGDGGYKWTNSALAGSGASQTQVEDVLSVKFYYSTDNNCSIDTTKNCLQDSSNEQVSTTLSTTATTISFAGTNTEAQGGKHINYDSAQSNNNYRSQSDTVLYVYAYVSWTSAYSSGTGDNEVVNAIDTWIGTNIVSISTSVTCEAVQASQLPSN